MYVYMYFICIRPLHEHLVPSGKKYTYTWDNRGSPRIEDLLSRVSSHESWDDSPSCFSRIPMLSLPHHAPTSPQMLLLLVRKSSKKCDSHNDFKAWLGFLRVSMEQFGSNLGPLSPLISPFPVDDHPEIPVISTQSFPIRPV